jgi:two-component system sensor histidine kinase/response regulator
MDKSRNYDLKALVVTKWDTFGLILKSIFPSGFSTINIEKDSHGALTTILKLHEQGSSYDVILIDEVLSDSNGIQFLYYLKATFGNNICPIIYLCSPDNKNAREQISVFKNCSALVKPIHVEPLYLKMVELLPYLNNDKNNINEDSIKKILYVDDRDINRDLMEALFEDIDYECEFATNGIEAVEAVSSKKYDLILMDCFMPLMDGYQATERIRQHRDRVKAKIPIIAVTAHAFDWNRLKCLEYGMNDFVTIPYDYNRITNVINKWLK